MRYYRAWSANFIEGLKIIAVTVVLGLLLK
jgi:hypothetical protein